MADIDVNLIDLNIGSEVFPDESTDDAVARIVAAEPGRHGLTTVGRQARALQVARSQLSELQKNPDDYEARYNARVRECGGDPDEMMTGNKPRWTMDEDTGDVKDHETETVYPAEQPAGPEAAGGSAVGQVDAGEAGAQVATGNQQARDGAVDSGAQSDDGSAAGVEPAYEPGVECAHSWPEIPVDDTPCRLCGLKFADWCNS